jgi:hypothetical protein
MDNVSIIKYTVLVATFPLWSKILKLLWDDMKDALREEGGLWGPSPHPRRIEEIRREHASKEEILVHEPRQAGTRRDGFDRARKQAPGRGPAGAQGAGAALRRSDASPGASAGSSPARSLGRTFGRRPR